MAARAACREGHAEGYVAGFTSAQRREIGRLGGGAASGLSVAVDPALLVVEDGLDAGELVGDAIGGRAPAGAAGRDGGTGVEAFEIGLLEQLVRSGELTAFSDVRSKAEARA